VRQLRLSPDDNPMNVPAPVIVGEQLRVPFVAPLLRGFLHAGHLAHQGNQVAGFRHELLRSRPLLGSLSEFSDVAAVEIAGQQENPGLVVLLVSRGQWPVAQAQLGHDPQDRGMRLSRRGGGL
jgi:hypothetical protein